MEVEVTTNDNGDKQSQSSTENFEKKLHELFRVIHPLCRRYLRPSQIVPHLTFISAHASRIKKSERKSNIEAIKLLFEIITECDEPEKWTKFREALKEEEFLSLYKICDVCEKNEFDFYIKLFDLLSADFAENDIHIGNLSQKMWQMDSLTKTEFDQIDRVLNEEGQDAAILEFLSCLPSDRKKWLQDLLSCLLEIKKTDLRTLIKNKVCPLIEGFPEINDEECEDADMMDTQEIVEKKTLKLRNYQEELLEEPLKGKNCIIYAPTGSGKTIIALKLIEEHFAQKDGHIHKVIFLANQVALVQQQGRKCKEYLEWETSIVTGNNDVSEHDIPLEALIRDNDIIVLTPQVLLNNLTGNRLPSNSLSQFSLMIFDECHHTNKKHPYNGLMAMYLDEKLGTRNHSLPQIIGLTASIGVGGASTIEDTIDHIQTICANLDCDEICTIKEHRQDLFNHINNPTNDIINVPGLSEDKFKNELNKMMREIEDRFKEPKLVSKIREEIPALAEKLNECFNNREKDYYTNWLGDIKKKIVLLQSDIRWQLLDCWTFLDIYHNALIINDSCRIKDAIAYIDGKLVTTTESSTYRELQIEWEKKVKYFQELSEDPKYFNPLLKKLEQIIVDTIEENPDSRILLFLKTRALVSALEDWIKESERLKDLNPQQLVGGCKKIDNAGMTTQQQEKRISEFQVGHCKILVATLGEEGIDIQKCNLVLNYNHVKNEISSVQKRGRARADNSRYITLANNSGILDRETGNRIRERMMDRALEIVQKLKNENPEEYVRMKRKKQKQEKYLRDLERNKHRRYLQPGEYELRCMKCDLFLCSSEEIRVVCESQHTCLNTDFDSKVSVQKHPRPKNFGDMMKLSKIFCKKCHNDFGIKALYKRCAFPIIKISSFVLCDSVNHRSYERKWKDVPFIVKKISSEELKQFPVLGELENQVPQSK